MNRINATHFIEQFRVRDSFNCNTPKWSTSYLSESLRLSAKCGYKTIAIFRIKYKEHASKEKTNTN